MEAVCRCSGQSNFGETRMKVLVLNGVNLNMFGKRDPAQYGTMTLEQIDAGLAALAQELGVEVVTFQTNLEASRYRWLANTCPPRLPGTLLHPAQGADRGLPSPGCGQAQQQG